MKTIVNHRGIDIEIHFNQEGLINYCSHWELIHELKDSGIVRMELSSFYLSVF